MNVLEVCSLLLFFLLTATSTSISTEVPKYAKPGCNDTCGKQRISYPFGIGSNCSINEWYTVDCISSTPYLSALDNLEVLDINLVDQTVTVNVTMISDCQNPVGNVSQSVTFGLDKSPFLLSRLHNKFVMEGCGTAVILDDGSALSGCSTTCRNSTGSDTNCCLGISCCETTIPYHLKSCNMNITRLERLGGDGTCGSAFLVDKNSYVGGRFSRQSISVSEDRFYVPISLLWTLAESDYEEAVSCDSDSRSRLEVDLVNGTTMDSWKCDFDKNKPIEGNFYLYGGYADTEECTKCQDYCDYDKVYDVDGLVKDWNFTCVHYDSSLIVARIWIVPIVLIIGALGFYTNHICIIQTNQKKNNQKTAKERF